MDSVCRIIRKHERFLIASHIGPEGDAIGSQLAMAEILRQLGKSYILVNADPIPKTLKFMPLAATIRKRLKKTDKFDVALILDCASAERLGGIQKSIGEDKKIVNIDHHISNKHFGDINLVDTHKSSTGELLYVLAEKLGIELNHRLALYVYTSILTDTGGFKYPNTTSFTHKVVSRLLKYDLNPAKINEFIYESNTLASRKLLGMVLETMALSNSGRVAHMTMTNQMLHKADATARDAEDFVNYARYIKGVQVAMIFSHTSRKGAIKISFRSNSRVDVNKLAQKFGGGGHPTASGCMITGSMEKVKQMVLGEVGEILK